MQTVAQAIDVCIVYSSENFHCLQILYIYLFAYTRVYVYTNKRFRKIFSWIYQSFVVLYIIWQQILIYNEKKSN